MRDSEFVVLGVAAVAVLLLAIAAAALVAILVQRRRRRPVVPEHRDPHDESILRSEVAQKAASATPALEAEVIGDLTESGVYPIVDLLENLLGDGDFAAAEQWALNALRHHPDRLDIALQLAKVYYRSGQRRSYIALANRILQRASDLSEADRMALVTMGRKIAPDSPLFAPGSAPLEPGGSAPEGESQPSGRDTSH